jgi:methionine-rich copper-binding protein CopC
MRIPTAIVVAATLLALSCSTVWAHARPQSTSPLPNQRLAESPTQINITYDAPIEATQSQMLVLDGSGAPIATAPLPMSGNAQAAVAPLEPLPPGPYTVAWTSLDAIDGDQAKGFYTFVVEGAAGGILAGTADAQQPAADLTATLLVGAGEDGSSWMRVELSDTRGVERVRIRLSRPDLGEDLLDTLATGDGAWVLAGNELAVPGAWHAVVVVRRTGVFDDAQAAFDFTIDPATGVPSF